MLSPRDSYNDQTNRDIPSFIEPRPPLVLNPYMRPRPQKGKNLMELLMEDSEIEEPELVQVYLRLKPCNIRSNLYEVRAERTLITSLDTTTAGHGRRTQHNVSRMYTFSHIFGPESNQKEIFEHVVKDNLKKLSDGNSFTLLTYGASGSGKTFTLMGTVQEPGIVPRSLEYVFKVIDAAQQPLYKPDERGADKLSYAEQDYEMKLVKRLRQISGPQDKYKRMSVQLRGDLTCSNMDLTNRRSHYVWVSFIEIYNEGIYDLLAPGDRRSAPKLAIREDTSGNVYVKGATQAFVRSGVEAYDVMVAGKHNLQVAATGIHAQSSRSHSIFTITMLTETEGGTRSACVRLCDLAGCERAARTRNTGARMQESRAINSSLHVLERCIRMLQRRRTASAIVPYRESKLTRLLGAGLSGTRGEAVSMVVTLNPSPEYANETKHVLQLAAVAKDMQINDTQSDYPSTLESSTQDTTIGYNSTEVMKLRADNERLLFELKQAQARYNELRIRMEEKLVANEKTLWEVAEETKAMYTDYYKTELIALQAKMDEMTEDYESRLTEASRHAESSSKKYQDHINQLMIEYAVLEEKLSTERLARKRVEEEMLHLRTCIDERDRKSDEADLEENEDIVYITDSDHSDSEDETNESLEPTIRKEDINRSRIIRQSMLADIQGFNLSAANNDPTLDSVLEKSSDNLNDYDKSYESDGDNTYLTGEASSTSRFNESDTSDVEDKEIILTVRKATNLPRYTYMVDQVNDNEINTDTTETQRPVSRETYCFPTSEILNTSKNNKLQDQIDTVNIQDIETTKTQRPLSRETYCVPTSEILNTSKNNNLQDQIDTVNIQDIETTKMQRPLSRETYYVPTSEILNNSKKNNLQDQIATVNIQDIETTKMQRPLSRETYYVPTSEILNNSKQNNLQDQIDTVNIQDIETTKMQRPLSRETYCVPTSEIRNTSNNNNLQYQIATVNIQDIETTKTQRPLSRETYYVTSSEVLNISNDNKLHEHIEGLKSLKDDTAKCLTISKDTQFQKQNKILKSLNDDNAKAIHISKDIKLQENEKNLKSLKDDMAEVESTNYTHGPHKILPDTYVKKIISSIKQSTESNESLVQFERLEMETKEIGRDKKRVTKQFYNIKHTKETKKYFDEDLDKSHETPATVEKNKDRTFYFDNPKVKVKKSFFEDIGTETQNLTTETILTKEIDNHMSSSTVKDNGADDFEPSMIKKLLGKSITRQTEKEINISSKVHNSIDMFEELDSSKVNECETVDTQTRAIESVRNSIEKFVLSDPLETLTNDESQLQANCTKVNNTTVEFENIYKDITVPRVTEFDLLVSQVPQETVEDKHDNTDNSEIEDIKYNLRNKTKSEKPKTERKRGKKKVLEEEEVLLESLSKCESSSKPPRKNLRLRRRGNNSDDDVVKEKLADIVNLQSEFSDVTMDVPAPVKSSKDIPSPEKVENKENSPVLGIQSCPAKSVTRSRRKLFTPRAEPLEESLPGTGDSTEIVRIPRPSYHRPRARRKL